MRPIARTRNGSGSSKTRSASGAMVPLNAVATLQPATAPYRVLRYNLYPAADIQGDTAPGYSSGEAIAAMERIARDTLPAGMYLRMDRHRVPAADFGRRRRARVRARRRVRVHLPRGALREPHAAARRDPDRADVPARRDARREPARPRQQHPHADRHGGADRPRGEERDPDRRVRAPGRGARDVGRRCRDRGREDAACGRSS